MPLQVRAGKVVDGQGREVRLRGVCIGGWMNMENFIDGYPGSEHGVRAAVAEAIGEAKAQFFFERLLDHFLTESDLGFLKGLGMSAVRLPINYRHFESEAAPFEYLEAGFARLSRRSAGVRRRACTRSSTCTRWRAGKIRTGTPITAGGSRSSGRVGIIRIVQKHARGG
jgi:hypothetical protein